MTYRGDFRQEVDYPFSLGQFRFVPYVVGRYTWYSQSPDANQSSNDRLFAGAGVRINAGGLVFEFDAARPIGAFSNGWRLSANFRPGF